jgi:hypothetical protein
VHNEEKMKIAVIITDSGNYNRIFVTAGRKGSGFRGRFGLLKALSSAH